MFHICVKSGLVIKRPTLSSLTRSLPRSFKEFLHLCTADSLVASPRPHGTKESGYFACMNQMFDHLLLTKHQNHNKGALPFNAEKQG